MQVYGALYVGVVDTSMGMIVKWDDVEVVVKFMDVRGPMDRYYSGIGCENLLMRVDVRREGPLGRVPMG